MISLRLSPRAHVANLETRLGERGHSFRPRCRYRRKRLEGTAYRGTSRAPLRVSCCAFLACQQLCLIHALTGGGPSSGTSSLRAHKNQATASLQQTPTSRRCAQSENLTRSNSPACPPAPTCHSLARLVTPSDSHSSQVSPEWRAQARCTCSQDRMASSHRPSWHLQPLPPAA